MQRIKRKKKCPRVAEFRKRVIGIFLHSACKSLIFEAGNILAFCSIRPDRRYARRPLSAHLLRRMSWLLHEDFGEPTSWVAPHPFYAHLPVLPGGGLAVTVPFPSAVHSREALRRHTAVAERFDFFHDPRANLLSFAGSLKGSPTGRAIREAIDTQCRAAGEPTCKLHAFAPGADLGGPSGAASAGSSRLTELSSENVYIQY